jgi:hypothetical protein
MLRRVLKPTLRIRRPPWHDPAFCLSGSFDVTVGRALRTFLGISAPKALPKRR